MERGKRQVTRVRQFDGNFSGRLIAHLTDQHDVRVVTKDTADGQVKIHLRADFQLSRAPDEVLDRVFNGQDVDRRINDLVQCGNERRAFPGTRRTRQDNDALRFRDGLVEEILAKGP